MTPTHTLATRICSWCKVVLGTAVWPYSEEYGATCTTHGLCEKCGDECFDVEMDTPGEAA